MAILTEMISISLTPKQNEALEKLALASDRKVGALGRIAIREYLERNGVLSDQPNNSEDDEE